MWRFRADLRGHYWRSLDPESPDLLCPAPFRRLDLFPKDFGDTARLRRRAKEAREGERLE